MHKLNSPGQKHIIAIADTDESFVGRLRTEFIDSVFEIASFISGEQLLHKVKNGFRPFILIINTDLDGISGISAIDILRNKLGTELPIVVRMNKYTLKLHEQVVKRNVLFTFSGSGNIQDIKALINRIFKKIQAPIRELVLSENLDFDNIKQGDI